MSASPTPFGESRLANSRFFHFCGLNDLGKPSVQMLLATPWCRQGVLPQGLLYREKVAQALVIWRVTLQLGVKGCDERNSCASSGEIDFASPGTSSCQLLSCLMSVLQRRHNWHSLRLWRGQQVRRQVGLGNEYR